MNPAPVKNIQEAADDVGGGAGIMTYSPLVAILDICALAMVRVLGAYSGHSQGQLSGMDMPAGSTVFALPQATES